MLVDEIIKQGLQKCPRCGTALVEGGKGEDQYGFYTELVCPNKNDHEDGAKMSELSKLEEKGKLKLDLGCGPNRKPGFLGVDSRAFEGVDQVVDLTGPWPWVDDSVEEAFSSHFIEHLTARERTHFANELHRVLVPGGKATLVAPHFASCRSYGDPTHQWPPVSEFWFYYVLRSWRDQNAPHTDIKWNPDGFSCDFDATWGYSLHPGVTARNAEFQQFAMTFYKEAVQDIIATLIKRKP